MKKSIVPKIFLLSFYCLTTSTAHSLDFSSYLNKCNKFYIIGESKEERFAPLYTYSNFEPDSHGSTIFESAGNLTASFGFLKYDQPIGRISRLSPDCSNHFILGDSIDTVSIFDIILVYYYHFAFDSRATLYFILKTEAGQASKFRLLRPWDTRIFFVIQDMSNLTFTKFKTRKIYLFCPFCSTIPVLVPLSKTKAEFESINVLVLNMNKNPVQLFTSRPIYSGFGPQPDFGTCMNPFKIPQAHHILFCLRDSVTAVVLLAEHFNSTIVHFVLGDPRIRYTYPTISPPPYLVNRHTRTYVHFGLFHRPRIEMGLLYCTESKDYQTTMSLLTVPADTMTWIMTVLHYMILGGTYLVGIGKGTASAAILGLAILLRQNLRAPAIYRTGGVVLLLHFGAMVITSGYESFLTSQVIVPPEQYVFHGLTELLDNGYQILLPIQEWSSFQINIVKYHHIFRKTGNLRRINSSFYLDPKLFSIDSRLIMDNTSYSNGTPLALPQPKTYAKFYTSFFGSRKANCHFMKGENVFMERVEWTFANYFASRFETFIQTLSESGILDFYKSFVNSIYARSFYERSSNVQSLSMSGHVRSLFLLYGICIVMAILYFIYEVKLVRINLRICASARRKIAFL